MEWEVSSEKQQLVIYRRDRSLHLLIHIKKVRSTESIQVYIMLPSHTLAGGSDLQPCDSPAGAVHWGQLAGIKN